MPDLDNLHPHHPTGPRVACPACDADIASLPPVARYCHRCGSALPCHRVPRARWLVNLWFACSDSDWAPQDAAFAGRSEVLLAYGKSMFNLGWRYEHAVGARRNLAEAARCYWKAARLGDPSAVGRLGGEVLNDPAELSPPATPVA